jgi:mannose-6-phosphate isomerase-like protein (cupin superfamily)
MCKRWGPRRICVLLAFLGLVSFSLGCKSFSERGAKGVGLLPKAAPGETKFSSYQPAKPYQQLAKGLLGRKLYESPQETGAAVQVHDLLVGPNQHSESYSFPGTTIFEVRMGSGQFKAGDQSQHIEPGKTVTAAAGQPFTIDNETEVPIAMRIHVLGSK